VVGGPAAARERINAAIVAIMAVEMGRAHDKFTPEAYAQEYIDDAADNLKENPFSKGNFLSQPSGSNVSVNMIRNAAPVFSVACATTSYGGAHPNFTIHYLNLDPVTGGPIKLASILKEGALARLTAIAEVHFREERELAPTAKLGDEGFDFPGGFALNDNYGFSEKALVFAFNPYEIASGGMGATLVEIPYAEIRDLIRLEFPL
jgi:hypothetical protein